MKLLPAAHPLGLPGKITSERVEAAKRWHYIGPPILHHVAVLAAYPAAVSYPTPGEINAVFRRVHRRWPYRVFREKRRRLPTDQWEAQP